MDRDDDRTPVAVQVHPASYVTVKLAVSITGLTQKAIYKKIETGVWLEGKEYRRAPDGRLYISLKGFERWVERA